MTLASLLTYALHYVIVRTLYDELFVGSGLSPWVLVVGAGVLLLLVSRGRRRRRRETARHAYRVELARQRARERAKKGL